VNAMFETNKEMAEKKCNECGEVKSDVKFRTWDGIDAAEWDIICESCLKKREREIRNFWVLLMSTVVMGLLTFFIAVSMFI